MNKLIKTLSFLLFLIPIATYAMNPTSSFTKVSDFAKASTDRSKDRSLFSSGHPELVEGRRTGKEQSDANIDREGQELLDRLDKLIEKIQVDIKYSAIDEEMKQRDERIKRIRERSRERIVKNQINEFKPSNHNSLIIHREPMPIDDFMSDTESVSEVLFLNEHGQPKILVGPRSGSELMSPYHPKNFPPTSNFFISDSDVSDTETDEKAILEEIPGSDWDSGALENVHDKATIRELLKDPMYRDMSVNMDTTPENNIISRDMPLFLLIIPIALTGFEYYLGADRSYADVMDMINARI